MARVSKDMHIAQLESRLAALCAMIEDKDAQIEQLKAELRKHKPVNAKIELDEDGRLVKRYSTDDG